MVTAKTILVGSICVASGQIIFGIHETIVKLSTIKITQLLFGRWATQLLLAIIFWIINKRNKSNKNVVSWYGDKPYILNIWIRGLLHPIGMIGLYYAVRVLPIGDVQCIFYLAPLLLIFMAWILLKEQLPNILILVPSVILTISGLILLSQPHFLMNFFIDLKEYEPLNIYGIIALLIGATRWVICVLLVRKAKDSHFLQLDMVTSIIGLLFWLPILMIFNQYITNVDGIGGIYIFDEWLFDLKSIGIMMLVGICGFSALNFNVIGYQIGSATTVSWLEYINIPIGFIYQTCIFSDIPNEYEIIGASMVTIACLLPSLEHLYSYLYTVHAMKYDPVQIVSDITHE